MSATDSSGRVNSLFSRFRRTADAFVQPRETGLPNFRVLLIFPALLCVLFIIAVATGVSGSSTGIYWDTFGKAGVHDPALLAGQPRIIRTDEWLVQSSWIVSQEEQGFPAFDRTFPGGMDATIQNDLPSWDWSTLFRPHVAGFLFLPLDQGMAVRWWLPALALLAGCYVFVVTLLPRRPLTAALLSVGVYFTPLVQWWFLPTTIFPFAFAFLAMTAVVWALKDPRLWARTVWAAVAAYTAVTTAMSIYAPFIVPAALVVLFFAVGAVLAAVRSRALTWRAALKRLIPLIAAVVAAAIVLAVWLITRFPTIKAVLSTVYPGQRLQPTGALWGSGVLGFLAGPLDQALWKDNVAALGGNQSESSSVILIAVFVLPAMIWLIVTRWRTRRSLDWALLSTGLCTLVVLAFLFIPGWDALSHLLLLDRTTESRIRLSFALLGVVSLVLIMRRLDQDRSLRSWPSTIVTTAFTVLALGATVAFAYRRDPSLILGHKVWIVVVVAIIVGIFLVTRGRALAGSAVLLIASLGVGIGVNPLYHGVFDLNNTAVGRAVAKVDDAHPGTWVGIGTRVPTAVLVESDVRALNGVQTYPPAEMWKLIDPKGKYEDRWNRLANVNWVAEPGEPMVTNPVRDQIVVSFDSCSSFAKKHISYVLTDSPLDQQCVQKVREVSQGQSTFWIYRVLS